MLKDAICVQELQAESELHNSKIPELTRNDIVKQFCECLIHGHN